MTLEAESGAVVVLDFETSGISPDQGHRAIEIGAVVLRGGRLVDRFQRLINPGFRISSFIESYTGITNGMLRHAPSADEVMAEFFGFIGTFPLVAHNAAFDRRFLDAELGRIGLRRRQPFGCSMLVARRIYPDSPNHRLETLVRHRALPTDGTFHRALADAAMTAHLWQCMADDLRTLYGFPRVTFDIMNTVASIPRNRSASALQQLARSLSAAAG